MNIKIYEEYKPIVEFFFLGRDVCYKYNDNIEKFTLDNINDLKEKIEIPYKISFSNSFNMANIGRIISYLKPNEDIDVFIYRIKNPKTKSSKFYAILSDKQKIKKK